MVRAVALASEVAPEEALEWVAVLAALVAAGLGLVGEAADLGLAAVEWAEAALELAVAVLALEQGEEQGLELAVEAKHLESG
jgi:hypothetical protein